MVNIIVINSQRLGSGPGLNSSNQRFHLPHLNLVVFSIDFFLVLLIDKLTLLLHLFLYVPLQEQLCELFDEIVKLD